MPSTGKPDPDLIYDVGAHRGEDTEFYLKKGFRVVAIEANPDLARSLARKFAAEIASERLALVDCAIARVAGEVTFFVNESASVWGTTRADWAERNRKLGAASREITVAARTFGAVLAQYGVPHYLKVDVEGVDLDCIRALADVAARPNFVSIESNKVSWAGLLEEFDILTGLGYTKFKVVDQRAVPSQQEPSPALEGRTTGHVFHAGSSGLFGNDLPGIWLTAAQAIARYRRIFFWYKYFGDNTFGERLIRRLRPLRFLRRFVGWYDTHAARG